MTQGEFKAWFDGFSEAIGELPTAEQWAKVKKRAAEIDGKTVTERIYVDRYWPNYVPYYPYYTPYSAPRFVGTSGVSMGAQTFAHCNNLTQASLANQMQGASLQAYNSTNAMYQLGKVEAVQ